MNIENFKNLIEFYYNDLLEREPDELGLKYFLVIFL